MTVVPITSADLDAAEVSWFSALCSDDYQFLGVPEGDLRSSWAHCSDIVKTAEAQGFRIRRLRYLNGAAVALEEIWLDRAYAREISAEALSHSLYHYYQEVLGLRIARVEDQLHLGEMPDWAASSLRPGVASGLVERKSWAQDGALAEISRTWFDTTKARYVARLR